MSSAPITAPRRCAIYTRKSVSAGLEMDFNSLDAQREACEAYIQRQQGWVLVPSRYDDGGYTGANTDRPAQRPGPGETEREDLLVLAGISSGLTAARQSTWDGRSSR